MVFETEEVGAAQADLEAMQEMPEEEGRLPPLPSLPDNPECLLLPAGCPRASLPSCTA